MNKLTKAQRAALFEISEGRVHQQRFGYGAWRIQGASPTVVGKLVQSLKLAVWLPASDDRRMCAITPAGRAALAGDQTHD